MAADLDDMRAIAQEMRGQHLPDRCGGAGKMRQAVALVPSAARGAGMHHVHDSEFIVLPRHAAYNTGMSNATQPPSADWRENAFDLTRGIAAYSGSPLVAGLARVIAKHPDADIANAFNHKQVACKMWARDRLLQSSAAAAIGEIWVVGGWYGVLAAMFFEDARFDIGRIHSIDIDPHVGTIAETLNRDHLDRFGAMTADMYALDYAGRRPDLVVNTSCEHIADLRAWLALLPPGTRVLLQSNDYFSEPTHIDCVASLEAFRRQAALSSVEFAGELPMKKYTRFMLIGTV